MFHSKCSTYIWLFHLCTCSGLPFLVTQNFTHLNTYTVCTPFWTALWTTFELNFNTFPSCCFCIKSIILKFIPSFSCRFALTQEMGDRKKKLTHSFIEYEFVPIVAIIARTRIFVSSWVSNEGEKMLGMIIK